MCLQYRHAANFRQFTRRFHLRLSAEAEWFTMADDTTVNCSSAVESRADALANLSNFADDFRDVTALPQIFPPPIDSLPASGLTPRTSRLDRFF